MRTAYVSCKLAENKTGNFGQFCTAIMISGYSKQISAACENTLLRSASLVALEGIAGEKKKSYDLGLRDSHERPECGDLVDTRMLMLSVESGYEPMAVTSCKHQVDSVQ
jgi:hypothetical protein